MSEIINQGDQTIIKPGIDVVASMADEFKSELLSVINESSAEVVIDLDGVEMVDSVGIGVIIASHNTLNQSDRKLKVINVTKDVIGWKWGFVFYWIQKEDQRIFHVFLHSLGFFFWLSLFLGSFIF